ncbi:MAG: betaine--homocysteine S-methyltransferase, partial [Actinobacteria bacterium]|nr:betaine--homocysteine S-methyltransferase [Actinomycetota bacterium]
LQAMTITPEGVRQDDVGAGVDELLMETDDALRVIGDPELRRLTRLETNLEIVGAGGTVSEKGPTEREEVLQARSHDANASPSRFRRSRLVADAASRPVVVAGSVGPTGELFEPLGALTHDEAVDAFAEQIEGLKEGGADVAWIETMSAPEEMRAAAEAAIRVGMPYVCTMSFDTAGRTMMGLAPNTLAAQFADLSVAPLAIGANCGVGASDILVSVLEMTGAANPIVCKGNCGIPKFEGTTITYSGTPELMAKYARLAVDAGARIIGGCCGTSPEHLRAMAESIAGYSRGQAPSVESIVATIGPLTNKAPSADGGPSGRRRRG